jgi:ribonuclease HI
MSQDNPNAADQFPIKLPTDPFLLLNKDLYLGPKARNAWLKTAECLFYTTSDSVTNKNVFQALDSLRAGGIGSIKKLRDGIFLVRSTVLPEVVVAFAANPCLTPSLLIPSIKGGHYTRIDWIPYPQFMVPNIPIAVANELEKHHKISKQPWNEILECKADISVTFKVNEFSGRPVAVCMITPKDLLEAKVLIDERVSFPELYTPVTPFIDDRDMFVPGPYTDAGCYFCRAPKRHNKCKIQKGMKFFTRHTLQKKIINSLSSQSHLCPALQTLQFPPPPGIEELEKMFPSPEAAGYAEDVLMAGTDDDTTVTPPENIDLSGSELKDIPDPVSSTASNRPSHDAPTAPDERPSTAKKAKSLSQSSIRDFTGGGGSGRLAKDQVIVLGDCPFRFRDVTGDGSCFFHAIRAACSIFPDADAKQLRSITVDQLVLKREFILQSLQNRFSAEAAQVFYEKACAEISSFGPIANASALISAIALGFNLNILCKAAGGCVSSRDFLSVMGYEIWLLLHAQGFPDEILIPDHYGLLIPKKAASFDVITRTIERNRIQSSDLSPVNIPGFPEGIPAPSGFFTFNVTSWNCCNISHQHRFQELKQFLSSNCPDVVFLQEFRISPSDCKFDSYHCVYDPSGLAVTLIKEDIIFSRDDAAEKTLRKHGAFAVCLQVFTPSRPLLLINFYNHPEARPTSILELEHFEYALVGGDFNAPGAICRNTSNSSSQNARALELLLKEHTWNILSPDEWTFFRGDYCARLDLFTSNVPQIQLSESFLVPELLSDHQAISIQVDTEIAWSKSQHSPFPRIHWKQFEALLSKQDCKADYDPQTFCSEMKSFLSKASAPSHRSPPQPWWNLACTQAVRERSKALRVWKFIRKRFSNEEQILKLAESNFKEARKASRKIFKFHKQEWLVRNLSNAPRDPWKGMRPFLPRSRKKKLKPVVAPWMAAQLAEKLCSEFEQIQLEAPVSPAPPPSSGYCRDEDIADVEISAAVNSLKHSSAPGFDSISGRAIKYIWESPFKSTLTDILSQCWRDPSLFSCFKHAIVIPIPKPRGGWRPISLLSQVGKLLERILARRLSSKLTNFNQNSGCRPHHSINDCLEQVHHLSTQHECSILILLDIRKAYDRIPPEKIIEKMRKLGFSHHEITWTAHFLNNRSFAVRVGSFTSHHTAHPTTGLPQGSPLSIVLFHIFFIDVPIDEDDNAFMDDLAIFIGAESLDEASEDAQIKLDKLSAWAADNNVIFDQQKTQVLTLHQDHEVHLYLQGWRISVVHSAKYLGAIISSTDPILYPDSGFSFESQVHKNIADAKSRLYFLGKFDSPLHKRILFNSLVRPLLLRNILHVSKEFQSIEQLQKVQNLGLRRITGTLPGTPPSILHHLLNVRSIEESIHQVAASRFFKLHTAPRKITRIFENWVQFDEGWNNQHSPFGWLLPFTYDDDSEGKDYLPSYKQASLDMFAVCSSTKILLGDLTQKLAQGELKYDIFIFTDGGFDRANNSGSAGIYICDSKGNCLREFGRRFVPVFSSTQAERLAMKEGLIAVTELAAFADASGILLLCDSKALLKSIRLWAPSTSHFIDQLCADILGLLDLDEGTIDLGWVPGHSGVLGNERADRQATNAQLLPVAERVPLELQAFRKKALQFSHHQTIDHAYFDSFQFTKSQLASIRKHHSSYFPLICRLITNHARFRYHWAAPTYANEDSCPFCQAPHPTPVHFISQCGHPRVEQARMLCEFYSRSLKQLILDFEWDYLASFFLSLTIPI